MEENNLVNLKKIGGRLESSTLQYLVKGEVLYLGDKVTVTWEDQKENWDISEGTIKQEEMDR